MTEQPPHEAIPDPYSRAKEGLGFRAIVGGRSEAEQFRFDQAELNNHVVADGTQKSGHLRSVPNTRQDELLAAAYRGDRLPAPVEHGVLTDIADVGRIMFEASGVAFRGLVKRVKGRING